MTFDDSECRRQLYGELDRNLRTIEELSGVTINARGEALVVAGLDHERALAAELLRQLYALLKTGYPVYPADIAHAARILERTPKADLKAIFLDQVCIAADQRIVTPKSQNQKNYIEAMRRQDIVFGIGPAGTGKTYLAVAMAVAAYLRNQVKTIVLTRPAVEAGEKLGFLPGDLAQKINPYLRPLHDALHDMLGREKSALLIEQGTIEIAPLAFMRGRTLNSAFIILDEAQNCTIEQMKMFLTRLGFNSRAVITGDLTQSDLPAPHKSGLLHAAKILKNIEGIAINTFDDRDVVRHPLVRKIILAYEKKKKLRPARTTRKKVSAAQVATPRQLA